MRTWLVGLACLGCSVQSFGTAEGEDAGGDGAIDQEAGEAEVGDQEAGEAGEEPCIPFTCEELGYQCGTENSDGCGNEIVCGSPYERADSGYDWPATIAGVGCPQNSPHAWACGDYAFPGGDPPFSSCVPWPGSATWCCTEG